MLVFFQKDIKFFFYRYFKIVRLKIYFFYQFYFYNNLILFYIDQFKEYEFEVNVIVSSKSLKDLVFCECL